MTRISVPDSGFMAAVHGPYLRFARMALLTLSLLMLVPLLSGCLRFGLETLHSMELKGTPYELALVKEYMAFSESEAKLYDWIDGDHFARKAIAVLEGKDVQPETINDWDIPETMVPTLAKAREDLVKFITPEMKETQAQALAGAIASFDCWLEQQEEMQPLQIAECRDRFYEQLNILNEATLGATITPESMEEVTQEEDVEIPQEEATADGKLTKEKGQKQATDKNIEIETPIEQLNPLAMEAGESAPNKPVKIVRSTNGYSYLVYFEAGKTTLGREGMIVVNKIVTDLRDDKEYQIVLNGYADQSGNKDFNHSMSVKRAEAVKKALVDRGIEESAITAQGLGAGGAKGTNAPENRRVEVFIINQNTK